ncbi:hypothetical protein AVL61_12115 [Kocuria rosea subsp. polaris]|uniref:Gram-positive cocci surface proteins LPxTG domain-containing protein n=1 Tax=Kocuria rosea subsp. polaris TaxID=136273 RepID=A0A0W8I4Q3_KOCRO|nr:hypothetical protein AVL61_12115 [Kocuria polaris]
MHPVVPADADLRPAGSVRAHVALPAHQETADDRPPAAPGVPAAATAAASSPATGLALSVSDPVRVPPAQPDSLAYTGVPGGVLPAGVLGALLLVLGAALRRRRA